ncbi:acyltransferase [Williamsia sp.]|uniref:acyltransferase n=1 Tax=Williamsia sp. TaxID=1872085 RepID=UPI0025DD9307|nr:acyltransferase [Williamsia sp.]
MRARIEASYVSRREIGVGFDDELTDYELGIFIQQRVVEKARAVARGLPQAFIGKKVRIRFRHRLTVGRDVAIGDHVEISALSRDGVRIGDSCTIDRYTLIRGSGGPRRLGKGVELSSRVAIGMSNFLHGGGGIYFGPDTMTGPGVQIYSEHHVMSDPDVAVIDQSEFEAPVRVEEGAVIGAQSLILGPVTIGRGAIVAAGSVVTSDVEPFSVVAGVPAKVVRARGPGGKRT